MLETSYHFPKKRLNDISDEIAVLSDSLTKLLSSVPNLPRTPSSATVLIDAITEESVKQFRSRVARRIYRYSALLREFGNLWNGLKDGPDKEHCEEIYEKCAEDLERYKTAASQWWRHIERQFHRLRMASLLARQDGDKNHTNNNTSQNGSAESQQKKMDEALMDLKEEMIAEADRMRIAGEELEISSKKLHDAKSLFDTFGKHLSAASSSLSAIKLKAETDARYSWGAFIIFISVCGFIILKRLRILSIVVAVFFKILHSIIQLFRLI